MSRNSKLKEKQNWASAKLVLHNALVYKNNLLDLDDATDSYLVSYLMSKVWLSAVRKRRQE